MTTKDTYSAVLDELMVLTEKKRAGYSPGDDPFKNFRMSNTFGVDPVVGILIRVMDKIARVASLLQNPDNDKVGESIRETMLDAGNYLLIAVAYADSEKQKQFDMDEDMADGVEGHDPKNCRFCEVFDIDQQALDEANEARMQRMISEQDRVVMREQDMTDLFDSSDMDEPEDTAFLRQMEVSLNVEPGSMGFIEGDILLSDDADRCCYVGCGGCTNDKYHAQECSDTCAACAAA